MDQLNAPSFRVPPSPLSFGALRARQKKLLLSGLVAASFSGLALFNLWRGEVNVYSGDWWESGLDSALHDLQLNNWAHRVATFEEAKTNYGHSMYHEGAAMVLTANTSSLNSSHRWSARQIDAGRCLAEHATSSRAACLPSLVCIGAMKAGTFELRQWVAEHPLVRAAKHERHFFGFGDRIGFKQVATYANGDPNWSLSRHQINRGTITFEKSPYYLSSTVAAMELHQLLPSVKLVVLLRDPKARAYSSFHHHCRNRRIVLVPSSTSGDDTVETIIHDRWRVVFNSDCAAVEHCCCSPHDLRPKSSLGLVHRSKSPRGLRAKVTALAAVTVQRLPRHLGAQGQRRSDNDEEVGENDENDNSQEVSKSQGTKATGELATCNADAFERYLESTTIDPDAADLGTVLRKGLYARQLNIYLELFGASQLLVLDGAAFARDPHETLGRVFHFVGLPEHEYGDTVVQNAQGYWYVEGQASKGNKQRLAYEPILPSSLARLAAFYAQPDEELRALFSDEVFSWLSPAGKLPDAGSATRPVTRRTEDSIEGEGEQIWMDKGR